MIHSDKEPDHVNEIGTKFWKDTVLTDYACCEDVHGRVLPAVCFLVETKATETEHSRRLYLLVDKATNKPIAEEYGVEAMGCRIDVLKFLRSSPDAGTGPTKPKRTHKKRSGK